LQKDVWSWAAFLVSPVRCCARTSLSLCAILSRSLSLTRCLSRILYRRFIICACTNTCPLRAHGDGQDAARPKVARICARAYHKAPIKDARKTASERQQVRDSERERMAHKLSDVCAQHLTGETEKAAQDPTSFCQRPRPPPLTCRRLNCLSRSAAVAAHCTEVQHTATHSLQHSLNTAAATH